YVPIAHRGKGAAVRTGVLQASGDPIVFLDADLTIPAEIVTEFLAALARGADIAVASRYVAGSRVHRPWWRSVMSGTFRVFARAVVPTGVQDTQCGAKAYRTEVARELFSRQRLDGFAFEVEVLFLARRAGYRIVEIPFTLRQQGPTSVDLLRDGVRMLGDTIRIRILAALGRYG
ncbi:MAG: glycosyltransferase, partial [Chloroflexota bacterium]